MMDEEGISSRSGPIEQGARAVSILPPLHKHTEGAASKKCENVGCAGPVTLPSLSALGIAGSVAPAAAASPSENGQAQKRCLWSTCTQIFVTIDELVRHLYKLHVATNRSGGRAAAAASFSCRWAACVVAATMFDDTEALMDHVCRDHLQARQVQHRCGWRGCSGTYVGIDALTEHVSSAHVGSGRSKYTCAWGGCERGGRPFAQRQRALRHMQTHTGAKPFACDECGKRFSEAHIMAQHRRVHTGERPFKCAQLGCGKDFAVSSALTIHRRTHTGERPYECRFDGCDRRFAESSNLTKHMRIHTGERPFKCPQPACAKAFSRPDQVARHQRMHDRRGNVV
ncbi:zinc-finger protein [Coemansia interrupta]|uniref:Zinc-finger protein n=1 Tax=Coemansia interrupta TaxID=1126814 RepID=A0A9W8HIZ5_9FUNG|nr:zinc-finger protein [Coemansia interrupta]